MAKGKKINFVFQGPVSRNVPILRANIQWIEDNFEEYQIIVSSWTQERSSELEIDFPHVQFVWSQDPGVTARDVISNIPHNVERQVVSTSAGLKHARYEWAAKLRTDIQIRDLSFFMPTAAVTRVAHGAFFNRNLFQ